MLREWQNLDAEVEFKGKSFTFRHRVKGLFFYRVKGLICMYGWNDALDANNSAIVVPQLVDADLGSKKHSYSSRPDSSHCLCIFF